MTKYLLKRLITGLLSVVAVVAIVMVLIYTLPDRELVFSMDPNYSKMANNQKEIYKLRKWEEYGYLDYVTYTEYLAEITRNGEITEETRAAAVNIARKEENDSDIVREYVEQFTEYYTSRGYTVKRLPAITSGPKKLAPGGQQQLFAYKDKPLIGRLVKFFTGIVTVDNIHTVDEEYIPAEERGLTFTLYDPAYGGDTFAPAIIGNGTRYKYLFYTTNQFPFIHQNVVKITLGTSYTVNMGVDVFQTMTASQGSYVKSLITYPSGLTEESADDLHSASYAPGSRELNPVSAERFTDDYTNTVTVKKNMSRMGFSFVIGILATILAYLVGVPIGIIMSKRKDKLFDKIGTAYIVFIMAVPSLAYIFIFRAIGSAIGLPTNFEMDNGTWLMYVLPIVSLALPSIASLMKWLRRYMIDQMNSDYVKFARSGGLSEGEIFSKHILKNAAIPLIHNIPADILFAMTGAIITESVYVVPGAGNLLTNAISRYDNSVIVGVTLFYALLSVVSLILGDILMAAVDPRISFSSKAR